MILHMHIMFGHQHAQVLLCRQITGKNRLGNHVQWCIQLQGVNDTPATRSFLSRSIQNVIEQIIASFFFMTQNGRSDLYQVTMQTSFVPLFKNIRHLFILQRQQVLHGEISFSNQLHIPIFYAIMHHFYIVACATGTYPLTTRSTILSFCRNTFQHRLNDWPCLLRTTGHDGRSMQSTLLTS